MTECNECEEYMYELKMDVMEAIVKQQKLYEESEKLRIVEDEISNLIKSNENTELYGQMFFRLIGERKEIKYFEFLRDMIIDDLKK